MTTTTKLSVAALAVALTSSSGCVSFLVRAAKGEITPMGVTQASEGDVWSLARSVREETNPQSFAKAFADLTSVYMYKCMENPTLVPAEGKSELRDKAGAALLEAMHGRVKTWGANDPVLEGASAEISALPGKLGKCDDGKRKAQDPGGRLTEAVALAQADARAEHVQATAKGLDASLEQALDTGEDEKVVTWVTDQCGAALPERDYCVPRAVEGFYAKRRIEGLANTLLLRSQRAEELLPGLAAKVGKDELVGEVRKVMTSDKALEVHHAGLDGLITFLRANQAWSTCDDGKGLVKASLQPQNAQLSSWAIGKLVEDGCRNFDDDIIKALASDQPWIRVAAAAAVGELKIQKAKKHVDRLRTSDPYMDEGCWCRPVRDAAANSYNKLEIDAG